jgi:RNA polymerase sigma-70 factor (ECF subfamily)
MADRNEPTSGTWITTTTLLDRLNDYDDRHAWDRLTERFRRPITAFALEVGVSPRDVEDVAQETLIAFAEAFRAGKYDRECGRLRSWLFGIAYRQSLAQRRRSARHPSAPEKTPPAVDKTSSTALAFQIWDRLWDRFLLERALEQAREEFEPAVYRAFELVALHDRAPADAAAELGVPVKAVYNAKHRVAKRVREWIAELDSVAPEADRGVSGSD